MVCVATLQKLVNKNVTTSTSISLFALFFKFARGDAPDTA
jgi:hypothetical protein